MGVKYSNAIIRLVPGTAAPICRVMCHVPSCKALCLQGGETSVKDEVDYQPMEKKRRGPGRPPKEDKRVWDEEVRVSMLMCVSDTSSLGQRQLLTSDLRTS